MARAEVVVDDRKITVVQQTAECGFLLLCFSPYLAVKTNDKKAAVWKRLLADDLFLYFFCCA